MGELMHLAHRREEQMDYETASARLGEFLARCEAPPVFITWGRWTEPER
jgi:hypothetical protein